MGNLNAENLLDVADRVEAMATLITNAPTGYNWGFYTREDPRMHLQVVGGAARDDRYKVWLETAGHRVFEPAGSVPRAVLNGLFGPLQARVAVVERRWIEMMIQKKWLTVDYGAGLIDVTAYPGMPHSFARTVDLRQDLAYEDGWRGVAPDDVRPDVETCSIEVFRNKPEDERVHYDLTKIVFEGVRML
jgi:hypothetical protein